MVNSVPETSSSTTYTPEPSSPLFLLPSDVPGISVVPVPFSRTGFGRWRRSMIVSLSARNKIGFIDGSCVKPAENSPQFKQWDRCNNMVISWLTSSLSPDIAESVQYFETAESIWLQLNNRYGSVNRTKVFEIKRELASTFQGTLDIASYFNKLKKLWDELGIMCSSHANSCVCAAKVGLQKEKEEDKVDQFLMGLKEVYIGVRSNILMMQPVPSLDTVYNILLQDEKQRQVIPNTQFNSESASFNANFNKPSPQFPPQKQYTQRVNFDPYGQKVNSDQTKVSLSCKYCKKPGHTIEKCYKLHGFPPNFKFTKGQTKRFGTAASVEGKSSGISESTSSCSSPGQDSLIPGLTKEQYSQLMNLLQQSTLGESSSQPLLMGSANFAGINSSSPVCLNGSYVVRMLTSVAGRVWIVDSRATDHMTSNKNLLFNIIPLPVPYLVSLPNGYKVKVTCTGSLTLLPSFTLHHVLYIPTFHYNLISVSKLIIQFNCNVLFTSLSCILLQAHSMKKLLELGRMDQGLYKLYLNHFAPPELSNSVVPDISNSVSASNNVVQNADFSLYANRPVMNSNFVAPLSSCTVQQIVNKNDVLWHHRLGHVPFVQMKNIPCISNDLSAKQSFTCPICPLARQPRLPFPDSSSQSTSLFQLIHVDTWGPYHTQTYSGAKYFITIVDDYSKAT
ncbi:PREDICTED: uncharacterized protein LOC109237601 [Nicotiana attenuata]|uniref:uncharacterized protein LOC109237601 n=1 Tax=Nicotiana attenuata TaxID=49451 RepID=UPI000904C5EE|nr:PREDICTED: uncharacterized protein LOC109237601 [Nicotiana attenuata]